MFGSELALVWPVGWDEKSTKGKIIPPNIKTTRSNALSLNFLSRPFLYCSENYLIISVGGPHNISFSYNPYSDPETFLADDLRGPSS